MDRDCGIPGIARFNFWMSPRDYKVVAIQFAIGSSLVGLTIWWLVGGPGSSRVSLGVGDCGVVARLGILSVRAAAKRWRQPHCGVAIPLGATPG